MKEVKVALCAGRHEIPEAVDGFIFKTIDPSAPYESIEHIARTWIADRFGRPATTYSPTQLPSAYADSYDVCWYETSGRLVLYVTGYTPALVAVLNAAANLGLYDVVLMHYNPTSGTYNPQKVRR